MDNINEILDNKQFLDAFKKHCEEEHLESFYKDALKAIHSGKSIKLDGDFGDEVFDAAYSALKDIGKIRDKVEVEVSPYDILEMKSISKDGKCSGLSVKFKYDRKNDKKKRFDIFGWCAEPVRKITKSRINSNHKKLTGDDIALLNRLVNRFENDVEVVLRNEKWYSKETIETYKKLRDSVNRIQDMIEVADDGLKTIPTSW